ncbi:MAG: pentapeptide repeat-containing protein [Gammaproteobacteria bacterium]|nr:pentapeptide repeat-containing protein [Gammaproteobacteria bacterium]MDH5652152.1 pentapeptide repeat-containing protein [Gammaproteobacteria bacterium]
MAANQPHLWYIRREGEVSGPFPTGQVVQYLVLGRFQVTDEASANQADWQPIDDIDELSQELEAVPDLNSARRWADERRRERRYGNDEEREAADRRQGETLSHYISRAAREMLIDTFWQGTSGGAKASLIFVGAVVVVVSLMILLTPSKSPFSEKCTAPFAQGVDLSHCDLADARINLSNLTRANLMGAYLQGARVVNSSFMLANLQYIEFDHAVITNVSFARSNIKGGSYRKAELKGVTFLDANLTYADFRGAKLQDVDFTGANMSHAIWTDGKPCRSKTIESCLPEKPPEAAE